MTEKNTPNTVRSVPTSARIYTTAKDTDLRLQRTADLNFKEGKQPLETELSIFINPEKTFQTMVGIGGAITDASAEVFAKMSPEKQELFLEAYYGQNGIGYSLLRTTIHSCDFSEKSYTYIQEGDSELETFDITPDLSYRVPLIKKAKGGLC